MANPLVSIIIPAYRHERFIRECIKSAINQSYSPLELLVIDDASPDGTLQAAESLRAECEARFVRTVMFSKEKGNTAASVNMGINMAQGKYIYGIASDDAAEPDAVKELVQVLEARPDVVLAVGDCSIMDEASHRIGWDDDRNGIPLEKARFKTFGEYLRLNIPSRRRNEFGSYASLLEGNYIPNGYLMRTEALRAVGGYNTSVLLEDWYMNLQLAKLGGMVYIPRILFRYRWHEGNVIKTYDTEETGRKIYREIYALEEVYCREHGLLSILRRRHPDSLHSRWHRGRRRILKAVNHIFYINLAKRKFSVLGREFHFRKEGITMSEKIDKFLNCHCDIKIFKLWNHCAKKLGNKIPCVPAPRRKYKKHIASQGYGYSGSSAVVGFFHEFSDVTIIGYPDNLYSKKKVVGLNIECPFFWRTPFIPFINSFACDYAAEKDYQIKRFIESIYRCYDKKASSFYDKNPTLYTNEFLDMALHFLCSVIDLDNYTIQFMKNKRFPTTFNSSNEKFNKCCFMKQKGIKQYLFYQFKNITQEEFDHYVKQFIEGFLNLFDSNEIFVSDQMFQGSTLETINKYLTNNPIKQICTYRDPRDQYLSRIRCYVNEPASPNDFINSYKFVINHLNNPYEHRLMVRFEDLVLKYNETTQKIMDFCGIDPARHVRPKAVFDPAISVVNIGAYKYFADQDFMRKIEEQLGEYCYYPEKENLSEEAWNLLKSVQ